MWCAVIRRGSPAQSVFSALKDLQEPQKHKTVKQGYPVHQSWHDIDWHKKQDGKTMVSGSSIMARHWLDKTKPRQDQDKTKTRPRQDQDKTKTRPRQDQDKTKTRPRQDQDKTKTRPRQDQDKTKTRPRRQEQDKTKTRQGKIQAKPRQYKGYGYG